MCFSISLNNVAECRSTNDNNTAAIPESLLPVSYYTKHFMCIASFNLYFLRVAYWDTYLANVIKATVTDLDVLQFYCVVISKLLFSSAGSKMT